jgi:hypothetical protein
MFRTSGLALILAFSVSLAIPVARAQAPETPTVESLVARSIEASGGLDRIKAVRTIRQTGSLSTPDLPGPVPILITAKRPNLNRQEVVLPGGSLILGFDGVQAWRVDPGAAGPVVLSGEAADAIEQQSDFDSPLVDYKAKGATVLYAGAETFNGKSVHHLKVTDKKGRIQDCYLAADTGLEVRIVSRPGPGEIEQQFSDYRVVGGIPFPFLARSLTGGRVVATITMTKIEFDVPLDDASFKIPR